VSGYTETGFSARLQSDLIVDQNFTAEHPPEPIDIFPIPPFLNASSQVNFCQSVLTFPVPPSPHRTSLKVGMFCSCEYQCEMSVSHSSATDGTAPSFEAGRSEGIETLLTVAILDQNSIFLRE
jgi:hypothetical protein